MSSKKPCFRHNFWTETLISPIFTTSTPPLAIHGWKAMHLSFNLAPSNRDLKDPNTRQNFDDTVEQKHVIDLRACHMLKLGKSCILRSTGSYLTANEPSLIIFNFMHTLRSCNDHQLNGPAVSRLLIENLSRILTISSLRCPPLPSYLGSKTCFCIIVGFSTTDLKVFVETRGVLWW